MTYEQAVWASALPSTQKLLALAWASTATDGRTAASFAEVGGAASLSRSAVIRGTQALVTAGWLTELERTPFKQTVYQLVIPGSA